MPQPSQATHAKSPTLTSTWPPAQQRHRHEDRRAGDRLGRNRHARVGGHDPALLQHGPARQSEHPNERQADAGADARGAKLGRQADRDADHADGQPGPHPRVGAFLTAGDRQAGCCQRGQAEHDEGRERRRHTEREAAVDATELHDLQQHADDGQPAEGRPAPAPGPQRERDGHERRQREARGEQRERIGTRDGQRAHDVARAPQQDERREDSSIGHASTVPHAPRATNPS
jgi:hypothetical protein